MNQQLEDYIKQARHSGKTDDQIRQELLSAGWQIGDIEESLKINIVPKKRLKLPILISMVLSVVVVGYFASAYYFNLRPFDNLLSPISTPSPTPISAVTSTDSWQTYTNTQYGFEFKYPGDLTICMNPETKFGFQVTINCSNSNSNSTDYLSLSVVENKTMENLTSSLNKYIQNTDLKIEEIKFADSNAFRIVENYSGTSIINIFILKNNNILHLFNSPNNLSDQILSTFKFIP